MLMCRSPFQGLLFIYTSQSQPPRCQPGLWRGTHSREGEGERGRSGGPEDREEEEEEEEETGPRISTATCSSSQKGSRRWSVPAVTNTYLKWVGSFSSSASERFLIASVLIGPCAPVTSKQIASFKREREREKKHAKCILKDRFYKSRGTRTQRSPWL